MASFLQRWEREKKRIENSDGWLTYQWEDLNVLDPAKKSILQQNTLSIPRFKNEEGSKVGRNIKYRDGRFRAWTGFRERLKPFYIYKNKIMVYWVPNMRAKTKGTWKLGVYMKPNFSEKYSARIKRALDLDLMLREQWNQFNNEFYGFLPRGIETDTLYSPSGDNSKTFEGGSIRNGWGRSELGKTEWGDDGELKNLKSAKQFAENIWKVAAINSVYLRWMDDESIDVSNISTPLIGLDKYPYGPENQQDSSSWYDYTPFVKVLDWEDIIIRPKSSFIINWNNHAPDV